MLRSLCTGTILRCLTRNAGSALVQAAKCSTYDVTQTTILVQEGLEIQEVPAAVLKTSPPSLLLCSKDGGINGIQDSGGHERWKKPEKFRSMSQDELEEMCGGFKRCHQPRDVFLLLETMPEEEVAPPVALQALAKLVELENNKHFRNLPRLHNPNEHLLDGEIKPEGGFTRAAIVKQLVDIICCSDEPSVLINTLKCISKDVSLEASHQHRICDTLLVQVSQEKLSLMEICELVRLFSGLEFLGTAQADKLWVGLVDRQSDIVSSNLASVAETLPHLGQSQQLVYSVVEKAAMQLWWQMEPAQMTTLATSVCQSGCATLRLLSSIARWLSVNIHLTGEPELLTIIISLHMSGYSDHNTEHALERYMRARANLIKDPALVAAVASYCQRFNMRNSTILESIGSFFISNAKQCSAAHIHSIVTALAHLDFHPLDGICFWKTLEEELEERFVQFQPGAAVDTLLGCVLLRRYPINQMRKVMNPFFLDRLHQTRDSLQLARDRLRLKLLDTAMAIECPHYFGPILPQETQAKSLWQDGRVLRCVNIVRDPLCEILGGPERFSTRALLAHLPLAETYVVDILIYPSGVTITSLTGRPGLGLKNSGMVAVLIHVPEHFCSDGRTLVGMQLLRHRHLKLMGFKVITLRMEDLTHLKVHPSRLSDHLRTALSEVLSLEGIS